MADEYGEGREGRHTLLMRCRVVRHTAWCKVKVPAGPSPAHDMQIPRPETVIDRAHVSTHTTPLQWRARRSELVSRARTPMT